LPTVRCLDGCGLKERDVGEEVGRREEEEREEEEEEKGCGMISANSIISHIKYIKIYVYTCTAFSAHAPFLFASAPPRTCTHSLCLRRQAWSVTGVDLWWRRACWAVMEKWLCGSLPAVISAARLQRQGMAAWQRAIMRASCNLAVSTWVGILIGAWHCAAVDAH